MGRLEALIKEETKDLSPVELSYAENLPSLIAQRCGADEVLDAIRMLDELSKQRAIVEAGDESWDGDAKDDIWRAQQRLASLLPHFIPKFASEVISGLQSDFLSTRLCAVAAIKEKPTAQAIQPLKRALSEATKDLEKRMVESALRHCLVAWE